MGAVDGLRSGRVSHLCPGAGKSPLRGLCPAPPTPCNCVTSASPVFLVFQPVMGLGLSFHLDQVVPGREKGGLRGVGDLYLVPGRGHPYHA